MEQTRSTLLKRSLTPWGKAGAALGIGVLVLAAVGLLFPTGAAFFPLVPWWLKIRVVEVRVRRGDWEPGLPQPRCAVSPWRCFVQSPPQ